MTLLLLFGALALVAAGVVAVPILLAMAVLWIVTLPFRLAFRLLFGGLKLLLGLGAAILSILVLPFVLLIAAIGLAGASWPVCSRWRRRSCRLRSSASWRGRSIASRCTGPTR